MTPAKQSELKIAGCPLCGAHMHTSFLALSLEHKRVHCYRHPQNECPLEDVIIVLGEIPAWNRRVVDRELVEFVKDMVEHPQILPDGSFCNWSLDEIIAELEQS